MFNKPKIAPLAAEFLGTATLVMVALVLANTTAVSYFIATSVAVALGVVIMLFGVTGRWHFNPAVTFGVWSARKMPTLDAVGYVIAQLLGGLGAWQLWQYLSNQALTAQSTSWNGRMAIAEFVGAAVLVAGYMAATYRKLDALHTALTVGGAFFAGIMIASVASSGLLNPAIALGLRDWNAVSVLGPLAGGLVGVNLFAWLFEKSR